MCQTANNSLGSGKSSPPVGDQATNSPTGSCPYANKKASILVEVYQANTGTILKEGLEVTLNGPSTGKPLEYASATKYFSELDPAAGYTVALNYDKSENYKGGRCDPADSPKISLAPGEMRRVCLRLYPPVSSLIVQAVDEQGTVIPDRFSIVAPKIKPGQYTESETGSWKAEVEPGDHDDIKVDLSEPALAMRYQLLKPGKVSVERGQEAVAKVTLAVRVLQVASVDHHFVPGRDANEQLRIQYHIKHHQDSRICLRILSDQHNPPVLFERELTADEKADGNGKTLTWDGRANCADGPLAGNYVNPLMGPLKVRLAVPAGGLETLDSDQTTTRVLVHSIKLTAGSYLPNPRQRPPKQDPIPAPTAGNWADHIKWVQFQLNNLGYFAGPVDGVLNPQTKRAIKRYTYEMVNTEEHEDPAKPELVKSLGTFNLLVRLMSDWEAITDKTKTSKLYIQHNYFYHTEGASGTSNYNLPDGHWHKESDYQDPNGGKLDRFEMPLGAEITLESRNQLAFDPNHPGVKSTEAVGELEIEWTAIDPPEDVSILPKYEPKCPTNAHGYIKAVRAAVTGVPNPTTATGGDNCPVDCGGFDRDFFGALHASFPVAAGPALNQAVSKVCQDTQQSADVRGTTGVLFRASHIGGDNYSVKACVSFEGCSNRAALEQDHKSFRKVTDLSASLSAETGTLTVWRKRRVTAVINWMEEAPPAVDWSEIVPQFESAFIELDVANVATERIDHFVTNATDAAPYLDAFSEEASRDANNGIMAVNGLQRNDLVFSHKHMIPIPDSVFVRRKDEKPEKNPGLDKFLSRIGSIQSFNNLIGRVTCGNDDRASVGDWLSTLVGRTRRPGHIVLRLIIFSGVKITKNTGSLFWKSTKTIHEDYGRELGTTCTGVGGGTAIISKGRGLDCKDGFVVAHEMAHCLYLGHPFDGPNPKFPDRRPPYVDHDASDAACTMWYHQDEKESNRPLLKGKGQKSPKREMKPGSTSFRPTFCGKCLLKLRGWKVGDKDFTTTPEAAPDNWQATPANPRMVSEGYSIADGSYMAAGDQWVECVVGATDPKDTGNPKVSLGPLKFVHPHRLLWESSDGSLSSLAKLETREHVRYRTPTQGSPFTAAADPDQIFGQIGESGSAGFGLDLHSVTLPSLICEFPLKAGELIGEQKYEYREKGGRWTEIPQSHFLLRKIVYKNTVTGEWVFKFVKENWAPHNPNPFRFEVQYKIGAKPFRLPSIRNNPNASASQANPVKIDSPLAAIYASGPSKASYSSKSARTVTLEELKRLGYLATEPWQ